VIYDHFVVRFPIVYPIFDVSSKLILGGITSCCMANKTFDNQSFLLRQLNGPMFDFTELQQRSLAHIFEK